MKEMGLKQSAIDIDRGCRGSEDALGGTYGSDGGTNKLDASGSELHGGSNVSDGGDNGLDRGGNAVNNVPKGNFSPTHLNHLLTLK
jgi:hypothetical protein